MKFEKGDKVRIIRDSCEHRIPIGAVVILKDKWNEPDEWNTDYSNNFVKEEDIELINKKGIVMTSVGSAVDFVKKAALKLTNNDEYELREAGIHDDCGNLTTEGTALRDMYLEELVREKLVATAKEMNVEEKSESK